MIAELDVEGARRVAALVPVDPRAAGASDRQRRGLDDFGRRARERVDDVGWIARRIELRRRIDAMGQREGARRAGRIVLVEQREPAEQRELGVQRAGLVGWRDRLQLDLAVPGLGDRLLLVVVGEQLVVGAAAVVSRVLDPGAVLVEQGPGQVGPSSRWSGTRKTSLRLSAR